MPNPIPNLNLVLILALKANLNPQTVFRCCVLTPVVKNSNRSHMWGYTSIHSHTHARRRTHKHTHCYIIKHAANCSLTSLRMFLSGTMKCLKGTFPQIAISLISTARRLHCNLSTTKGYGGQNNNEDWKWVFKGREKLNDNLMRGMMDDFSNASSVPLEMATSGVGQWTCYWMDGHEICTTWFYQG